MKTKLLISILRGALLMAWLPLDAADYFNPAEYQHNMTITGNFLLENIEISAKDTLFAYSGDQCRGYISPIEEPFNNQWFAYLVVYANGSSEEIVFKYYDETTGTKIDLVNTVTFKIDGIMGSPGDPYIFSDRVLSDGSGLPENGIRVNVLGSKLMIELKQKANVQLIDLNGRTVYSRYLPEGRSCLWVNEFNKGIYVLRIFDENTLFTRKIRL